MACARVVLGLSLLFRLRREDHVHLFAVQFGHRLDFGELFQIGGETQQQDFSLLLEHCLLYTSPSPRD